MPMGPLLEPEQKEESFIPPLLIKALEKPGKKHYWKTWSKNEDDRFHIWKEMKANLKFVHYLVEHTVHC